MGFVLLVEDNPALRRSVADGLRDSGFDVVDRDTAESAVAGLASEPPDVLVTDIDLGAGMGGDVLGAMLRRRWPVLPVVYLSGCPLEPRRMQSGARFLAKPFAMAALIDLMKRVQRPPSTAT